MESMSSNFRFYLSSFHGDTITPSTDIKCCSPKSEQASWQMGLLKIELMTVRPRGQWASLSFFYICLPRQNSTASLPTPIPLHLPKTRWHIESINLFLSYAFLCRALMPGDLHILMRIRDNWDFYKCLLLPEPFTRNFLGTPGRKPVATSSGTLRLSQDLCIPREIHKVFTFMTKDNSNNNDRCHLMMLIPSQVLSSTISVHHYCSPRRQLLICPILQIRKQTQRC